MSSNWLVLKFGGTSVAGRAQWETIAALARARREEGALVVLVCSAVAGVTSALAELAEAPRETARLDAILERHETLAGELGVDVRHWLAEARRRARDNLARLAAGDAFAPRADLLAIGEWLSTRIGAEFLAGAFPLVWVDVRETLISEDEPELSAARRWLSAGCRPGPDPELQARWREHDAVIITQGYVARDQSDATVLLGRGGSDTSAALLAGRLDARRVEIWTDVPGLFTADPRLVPQARLLERLDYAEALEMVASGAKVVHPRAIRAAQATGTPVAVRDTSRPGLEGTRIEDEASAVAGVKAITCQAGMVVLLLQNLDTRREVGFLARVFDIVRRHGVSVDLVATSETTTTVAINAAANHLDAAALGSLVTELEFQCRVGVHENCVCVNLVGREVRRALSLLGDTFGFFHEYPLLMMSQSANDLCLSLLLKAGPHDELLCRAHAALIPAGVAEGSRVFGPSWQDLAGS